jgi:Flp pilus assembly protein TadD
MPAETSESVAPTQRPVSTRLTTRRKVLFSAATVLVLGVSLEGLLAVCGVPVCRDAVDRWPKRSGGSSLFVHQGAEYVTRPEKLTYFNPQSFAAEKSPHTYRVFCLGGSTTYGHPYSDRKSYVGLLRELLQRSRPDVQWEIVNCGGISYASYRLAAMMGELAEYQPDLVILYTGQNEFLEEHMFGASERERPGWAAARDLVGGLRTATLFARWMQPAPAAIATLDNEVDAELDHTAGPTGYHRDSTLKADVVAAYRESVRTILRRAEAAGAEVLMIEPASNLRFSPFKSEHTSADFSKSLELDVLIADGRRRLAAGELSQAVELLQRAVEQDPQFADAHYLLGEALWRSGNHPASAAAYQRAIDEDVCPLRAISELHAVLLESAVERSVPVIRFPRMVEQYSREHGGQGVPGAECFLDHVHPRPELHLLLATEIAHAMSELRPEQFPTLEMIDRTASEVESEVLRQSPAKEEALALCNLAQVLTWGGKVTEPLPLAAEAVAKAPDDPWIICQYARLLDKHGRRDEARREYERAVALSPQDPLANYRLGQWWLNSGEIATARPYLITSRDHMPASAPRAIQAGLRRALSAAGVGGAGP